MFVVLIAVVVLVAVAVRLVMVRRGGNVLGVLYVPSQGRHGKFFTYDGRSLRGVKVGQQIELVVVPGVTTMASVYTGTVWRDCGCMSYAGRNVGFAASGYYKQKLSELADRHKQVRVFATVTGCGEGGWPVIRLDMPNNKWFTEALKGGDA